jgi:hypothetical protein
MLPFEEKYGRTHLALDKIIRSSILGSMKVASLKESQMTQLIISTIGAVA